MGDTNLQWWHDGKRQYYKNLETIKRLQKENEKLRVDMMRKANSPEHREDLRTMLARMAQDHVNKAMR